VLSEMLTALDRAFFFVFFFFFFGPSTDTGTFFLRSAEGGTPLFVGHTEQRSASLPQRISLNWVISPLSANDLLETGITFSASDASEYQLPRTTLRKTARDATRTSCLILGPTTSRYAKGAAGLTTSVTLTQADLAPPFLLCRARVVLPSPAG